MQIRGNRALGALGLALAASLGGCPTDLGALLDQVVFRIGNSVERVQERDPRTVALPSALVEQGDTIVINNNVTIIQNVQTDIVVQELPAKVVLGFENLTGFDIYIKYLADGDEQGILVFAGDTLLLEYPCLEAVEMLSEDDLAPEDGTLVRSFDLTGIAFVQGGDFGCGDAFIITFDPEAVFGNVEAIDLLD